MVSCGISTSFPVLFPSRGKVAHALLTRPPLKHYSFHPKTSGVMSPLDLHVLSTPPAFVLSQDQTLAFNPLSHLALSDKTNSFGIICLSFLRFSILYRFQGSSALGESLYILSKVSRFVNTFFEKNLRFFDFLSKGERQGISRLCAFVCAYTKIPDCTNRRRPQHMVDGGDDHQK